LCLALSACSSDGGTSPDGGGGKASLTISGTLTGQVGAKVQLAAEAKDAQGNAVAGAPVAWSSSNPTVIAVSGSGLVSADRIGTATITATWNGVSATAVFTSALAPYAFTLEGASAADQQTIRDGVQIAHAYYLATLGRTVQQAATISASTTVPGCTQVGGGAAFTGPHTITFCVGNPGWLQLGPMNREKVVMHELFHVLQFEMGWAGNPATAGPTWLIEGSAELMGYKAFTSQGQLGFPTALACQVKQVADFAQQKPPGLPNLDAVESQQAWSSTVGPLYALAMLGVDELTGSRGVPALLAFGNAVAQGTSWPTAFQTAFGTTSTAFYAQFPSYRAGLAVPPSYLCGG
jgi:hypothetical protein